MQVNSVRDSRAGDVFHYRWATRRCLRMINPKSKVKHIVIEGSSEPSLAGEYVMDVTEYYESAEGNKVDIAYFQLKHSTKRVDQPFQLSDLKDTIEGFASRFREYENRKPDRLGQITFSVITNRLIAEGFKDCIQAIAQGNNSPGKKQLNILKKYTQLTGEALQRFCLSFELVDNESNYADQKDELHFEMAAFFAGAVESIEINNIIALVQEQVLPNASGKITPENILKRFGVSSRDDLFPAPTEFETLNKPIQREQHTELLTHIVNASEAIIIHAGGGVGKSVVCRQLASTLPNGSVGIVYDCFGAGKYRNKSQPRHRYRDALVQIINEIAVLGLCETLIPRSGDLEDALLRSFLSRLSAAGKALQQISSTSFIAVFIDAADNAEMAAEEFNDLCFVKHLLREKLPENCRIIASCRPERIHLLDPKHTVQKIPLLPFSETETLNHLRTYFPKAIEYDALELHRLSGGNPRVQANALSFNNESIAAVLSSLGLGKTVDDQIAQQLDTAIAQLKELQTKVFQQHIDAICLGLANLHPFIPIQVLAAASEVDEAAIKSFVADLGRPLWVSENSVQFRDEPTETWFREQFSASPEQIAAYINRLKPLAATFNYVAEVLPTLLLRAEQYDDLIQLALSDDLLPDSPIDKRNVRVYRLQFAFKAALKQKKYADAAKLALRAGEEMAGDKRQLELLSKNTDLIAPLQSPQRVQELAFRRLLGEAWEGSENVYSAALLSTVDDFKGEARGYLRSANNWLNAYFEERKKRQDNHHNERLKDEDIAEMAFTNLNLFGTKALVDFINSWRPPELAFRITKLLVSRLIDAGKFTTIDEFAQLGCRNLYVMLAIADELIMVGRFPASSALYQGLVLLSHPRTRIKKSEHSWRNDSLQFAIISFAEACAAAKLCRTKVQRILRHYFPTRAIYSVHSDHADSHERIAFVRTVALKTVLSGNLEVKLDTLMPEKWLGKKKDYDTEQEIKRFEQVVGGLLPWYIVRAQLFVGGQKDVDTLTQNANQQSKRALSQRYQNHDRLPFELILIRFELLVFNPEASNAALCNFVAELSGQDLRFAAGDRLNAVRSAFRLPHLFSIKSSLERSCRDMITTSKDEGPETLADWYIRLARAVLSESPEDAKAYFDEAIEAVSKFGDELVERWNAIAALADRTADGCRASPETAYRFIRCAELVGENVAREKYWDRDGAIETCFKLHSTSAFAALSRWRDRDVGWFERQTSALAREAVRSKQLPASVGWSLSAFVWDYDFEGFAALCIELEADSLRRQYILDRTVKDLRLSNSSETNWQKLATLADRFSLKNPELQQVLAVYSEKPALVIDVHDDLPLTRNQVQEEAPTTDWGLLFADLELLSANGLSAAIDRFDAMPFPHYHEEFWQNLFERISEVKASQFLEIIVHVESADAYDVEIALSQFPKAWHEKISVQKAWPKIFQAIGQRFASRYSNPYTVDYFLERINAAGSEIEWLNQGVLEGLAGSCNLVDAATLFGFGSVVSANISPEQAADVLDFGLTRFEFHIDDNHADGPWAEWLIPPESITEAFAGFIWSALGSPRSAIRWCAAHCVRRLAEAGCEKEIDALISWMSRDYVGSFGSAKYPFYNLHARQYLLIAIARSAIDFPNIFKKHHAAFTHHALASIPHALIQKFAADIALLIESAFPGTYSSEVMAQLSRVGVSQFPIQKVEGYGKHFQSPWHERGEIDKSLQLHFGYDFDSYWFEPLGRVFGISSKQVEELAREIVIKDWGIQLNDEYIPDPRKNLWRSDRDRETWHDHGSYPKTDDYSFYLSYHAMLAVAVKLLQAMPIVNRDDWYENEWLEWLQRHSLSRPDNRWLADRRDPPPLQRRAWLKEPKSDNWRWEIMSDDFLDGLLLERDGELWLNVDGHWSDNDDSRKESFAVASALVNPDVSLSLLKALTTCSNPRDYKLPYYQEQDMEFKNPPFLLKGWIYKKEQSKYLDKYDPFAGDIAYPPYCPGESFIEQFGLVADVEQRCWCLPTADKAVLITELWGDKQPEGRDRDIAVRYGSRINGALTFLKNLCASLGRDLIIEVQIERQYQYHSYRSQPDDEIKYPPPYCKIYLLSADGTLRDTETCYRFGQSTG